MITLNTDILVGTTDSSKKEFYKLIEEGYEAMQDGQFNTIEEVREAVRMRRIERG